MHRRFNHSGFTLIELLIAIAIIAILTAFGTFAFQQALAKARDAQRRNDLKQLQTALQAYYNDYGSYPPTTAAYLATLTITGCVASGSTTGYYCGEDSHHGGRTSDYIPNLAPKYIRRLPNDPRAGKDNFTNSSACDQTRTGYLYISDGSEYKLMAHCTPEQPLNNPKDALYDPARAINDWAVYTDGAKDW
jgi:prepilin-type N-terminal cleavage/methylation domain-containing protein